MVNGGRIFLKSAAKITISTLKVYPIKGYKRKYKLGADHQVRWVCHSQDPKWLRKYNNIQWRSLHGDSKYQRQ